VRTQAEQGTEGRAQEQRERRRRRNRGGRARGGRKKGERRSANRRALAVREGEREKRTRGLLAWARVAAGPRGKERRGRKRSGPRGRGSRPKREEGEKGRPATVGLASLLFFLSLFYFFPNFQTQIDLNSDKL
jgi:hypothetical protein